MYMCYCEISRRYQISICTVQKTEKSLCLSPFSVLPRSLLLSLIYTQEYILQEIFSHWKKHQSRWCVSSLFLFIVFLSCLLKAASVSRTCFILETTHRKQNMRVCRQRQKNAYGIYLKCSLALDPILCKYLAESQTGNKWDNERNWKHSRPTDGKR